MYLEIQRCAGTQENPSHVKKNISKQWAEEPCGRKALLQRSWPASGLTPCEQQSQPEREARNEIEHGRCMVPNRGASIRQRCLRPCAFAALITGVSAHNRQMLIKEEFN